jgi:hypothetical protein
VCLPAGLGVCPAEFALLSAGFWSETCLRARILVWTSWKFSLQRKFQLIKLVTVHCIQEYFLREIMLQTIDAIFDGKVLVPQNGVQLIEGNRYKLIIQPFDQGTASSESAWDLLSQLVGTVEGPADWASEIDHYLYGTPKRNQSNGQ